MTDNIYHTLRAKIDEYSLGMRATESQVEIKILMKLFTEDEARMYLNLTDELHTAEEIAAKIGADQNDVENILQRMTEKGHTLPKFPQKAGDPFYYAAAPYMHGICEHQCNRMDKELADLMEEYNRLGTLSRRQVPLRVVPVQVAVEGTSEISTFDDAEAIIRKKHRIALTDCHCHSLQQARGETCRRPKEVCFMFDFYAQYYVDRNMGRWVTQEEALERLNECEKAGLVPQFSNSEDPDALCNCCPDCCTGLRLFKRSRNPIKFVATNFFAQRLPGLCVACGACIERCPMEAMTIDGGEIEINRARCIGCGLCVPNCSVSAINLQLKPEDERFIPPREGVFMKSSSSLEGKSRT